MPASIGVNLRVTGHCSQGGRKYMEDLFSVAYQQTEDERDLEYAFFGIYDGHGGGEAAAFAKEHLMDSIVKQRQFWSDNDEDVLKAIRNGYMLTHLNMWKEVEKWPKTVTGLPSTAGTTASIAFIRRGKIYIGHVGDSAIVLGYQKDGCEEWAAKPLTLDHKPECSTEIERIQRCGGKVVSKAGVPRVVWNRPRPGHKGPIKKNTPMDEIPFLAVARSLGDLWSYNPQNDEFIVSPDPDVGVLTIDPSKFRCLIFGTDGLWNMISPEGAVTLVQATEKHNEAALVGGGSQPRDWLNPSKSLVDHALERWSNTRMRADNTSVVTLMLDPPGPPRATVLRSRTPQKPQTLVSPAAPSQPVGTASKVDEAKPDPNTEGENRQVPQNGLTIMTRYSDVDKPAPSADESERTPLPPCASIDGRFSVGAREETSNENKEDSDTILNYGNPAESYFMARLLNRSRVVNTLSEVYDEIVSGRPKDSAEPSEPSPAPTTALPEEKSEESRPPAGPRQSLPPEETTNTEVPASESDDISIQINEVSSSSPTEAPARPRGRRFRESRREPAAPNDRVLRSHHEPEPQRPQTRQASTRLREPAAPAPVPAVPATPVPAPAAERVVILTRRELRPPPRRAAAPDPDEAARRTRSQLAARSGGGPAGNSPRAPGPARRAPAAPARSKENRGAARGRARARAARASPSPPSRPPRTRRADDEAEVHSTTADREARALRSRNDAAGEAGGAKRPRLDDGKPKCARALGKRASGPWAPALALRNRLRRRLVK
ncbi:probable protein phosphatase 2C 71 [Colias croceus]|uniref:probable protein phosphatase 2C 71 n=1 Tax=Colias crocea TaxID=72248 RepID=UPI001E28168F|nr:probable protein phosphatase 2C 71 [Colias croceus]